MPSPSAIRRAANALTSLPRHFVLSEQVRHALSTNQPLVALESTIITHGLPASVNLRVAQRCESVIEAAGATPATIALLDGRVHVGLEARQLERLASTAEHKGERAVKTARRDLAGVLASKGIGGTTVSATAHLASMAGIEFFATGGIGGVHRGAERTFDISSDLTTLSTTPINLFCSGCKSILSLPLTLEYLETQNVPVYSFSSPRGEFPAFYTAKSGLYVSPVPGGAAEGAAQLIWNAKRVLREKAGALFAVPIPEEYEEEGKRLQEHVERAVRESVEQGVHQRGKEVTPWLLKRVGELSEGRSLESNEALVVNNSEVAARTAVEYWKLRGEKGVEKSVRV
ncbi:indigoidine synthase A-like protein [Jaminaea rosea]|uniref:Indigoidine synthase A-like protein n=1 Tax=Jaminaea rosea TaxID=1569628 RepID=A0A316UWS6_9BASI|nr:indigoidine synthase A-like protein [Jaminaea rosea]PWN29248.1 indigoidine synthase A-like protein [Jaminaea rosea]